MRRPTAALAAILLVTSTGIAHAQPRASWSPDVPPRATTPDDGDAPSSFDPSVPAAITTLTIGGGVGLIGLASLEEPEGYTLEECGLTGCVDVTYPDEDRSWGAPLLVGGATTAAGGLALLLVSAADPARGADPGRARVAAGGMTLSLGAGLIATGVTARLDGHEGSVPGTFIATGVLTSAIGVPFLAWGAATWDESEPGERYVSSGRIVAGTILTSTGVVATAGSVALMAASADCGSGLCGFGVLFALPVLGLGGAGLGVGIPLLAGGARLEEHDPGPTIAVGPGSIDATWRFQ